MSFLVAAFGVMVPGDLSLGFYLWVVRLFLSHFELVISSFKWYNIIGIALYSNYLQWLTSISFIATNSSHPNMCWVPSQVKNKTHYRSLLQQNTMWGISQSCRYRARNTSQGATCFFFIFSGISESNELKFLCNWDYSLYTVRGWLKRCQRKDFILEDEYLLISCWWTGDIRP